MMREALLSDISNELHRSIGRRYNKQMKMIAAIGVSVTILYLHAEGDKNKPSDRHLKKEMYASAHGATYIS